MKIITVVLLSLVVSIIANGQAPPEALNYTSAIRGNNGQALPNKSVAFRFSIIKGTITDNPVYVETHIKATDQWGGISLPIGQGTSTLGSFDQIEWATDTYHLKIELDDNGGTNFKLMGTMQFLSVPYALHAKTASSVTNLTELDPVYSASVASGITEEDTIKWNSNSNSAESFWKDINDPPNNRGIKYSDGRSGTYEFSNGQQVTNGGITGLSINNTNNTFATSFLRIQAKDINTLSLINSTSTYSIEGRDTTLLIRYTNAPNSPFTLFRYRPEVGFNFNSSAKFRGSIELDGLLRIGDFNANSHIATYENDIPWPIIYARYFFGSYGDLVIQGISSVYNGNIHFVTGSTAVGAPPPTQRMVVMGSGNVGIGNYNNLAPASKLQVRDGDVYLDTIGTGVIMKSPNGNCWRVTVDNSGNLIRTSIGCP